MRSEKRKTKGDKSFLATHYSLFTIQCSLLTLVAAASEPITASPSSHLRSAYLKTLPAKATYRMTYSDADSATITFYADRNKGYVVFEHGGVSSITLMDGLRHYYPDTTMLMDWRPVQERVALFSQVLAGAFKAAFGLTPPLRDRPVTLYGLGLGLSTTGLGLVTSSKAGEAEATLLPVWLCTGVPLERPKETGAAFFTAPSLGNWPVNENGWLLEHKTPPEEDGRSARGSLVSISLWDATAPAGLRASHLAFCEDTGIFYPEEIEEKALAAAMSMLLNALSEVPPVAEKRLEKIEELTHVAFEAIMEEYYLDPAVLLADRIIAQFFKEKEPKLRRRPKQEAHQAIEELLCEQINQAGRALLMGPVMGQVQGVGWWPVSAPDDEALKAVLAGFSKAYTQTVAVRVARTVRWRLRDLLIDPEELKKALPQGLGGSGGAGR